MSFCPLCPDKRQWEKKSYCRLTKVEMVMTKRTLIIPIRILKSMAKVCAFLSIQPYPKVGTNLFDAQKGGKRQNTELYL